MSSYNSKGNLTLARLNTDKPSKLPKHMMTPINDSRIIKNDKYLEATLGRRYLETTNGYN